MFHATVRMFSWNQSELEDCEPAERKRVEGVIQEFAKNCFDPKTNCYVMSQEEENIVIQKPCWKSRLLREYSFFISFFHLFRKSWCTSWTIKFCKIVWYHICAQVLITRKNKETLVLFQRGQCKKASINELSIFLSYCDGYISSAIYCIEEHSGSCIEQFLCASKSKSSSFWSIRWSIPHGFFLHECVCPKRRLYASRLAPDWRLLIPSPYIFGS